MTTKPRKPLTLCTCRHCNHWRAKVDEVDAALGIMRGAYDALRREKRDAIDVNGIRSAFRDMRSALRDLVGFYDRATGAVRLDHGWTASDVKRLEQIRRMVLTR
jgi:hypothetical protein